MATSRLALGLSWNSQLTASAVDGDWMGMRLNIVMIMANRDSIAIAEDIALNDCESDTNEKMELSEFTDSEDESE